MDFKITAPFEPDGGHRSCSGLPELGKPILLRRLLIK